MTGIIILNWNGWTDTIECLQSLYKMTDTEFFIVLVDNGSTDNSVEELNGFLSASKVADYHRITEDEFRSGSIKTWNIKNKTTILYQLNENYGFAKGNNIGLELAKMFSPEYYILLNNDTEVEPDFLYQLVRFVESHPEYPIVTPKISFFFDKNLIWNCGGKLWWGFRKYYYAGRPESEITEKEYIRIGYITGCALFFKAKIIANEPLLTERFFHGEEDFEFSYRMRKRGIKIACVLASHIFHKVGRSTESLYRPGKTYAYYLNRFINMRLHMPAPSYILWVTVYLPYITFLLKRKGYPTKFLLKFIRHLLKEARVSDSVSQKRFLELLKGDI